MPEPIATPRRVLIFRTGSLGDTAFNLPIFHHLNRIWPNAEKRVLTNFPVAAEAAPLQAVLGESSFAQGYFAYPGGTRQVGEIAALARRLRAWKPDVAIYANECRGRAGTLRDGLFLRLCGARRVYGLPLTAAHRRHIFDPETGLYEREVSRIARTLSGLGPIDIDAADNRSLALSTSELADADALLADWQGRDRFVCFSPGTKQASKDWTDPNWKAVLENISKALPDIGLLTIGAPQDAARSDRLSEGWSGRVLNACGKTSPRQSAALMRRGALFIGNDSGPMHLAAAAGLSAVAVFSRHANPGVWFPLGTTHRIFYPGLAWSGGTPAIYRACADETVHTDIPVAQVTQACLESLGA